MAGSLEGKTCLVTGGGSGIGRAAALALAREGALVAVADLDAGGGRETLTALQEAGAEGIFVQADVTRAEEVEALVEKVVSVWGRLDCAFNNAGTAENAALLWECSEADWDRVIALNLKGVWLCLKYEIRWMLERQEGVIVNMASITGLVGIPQAPAYVASKHGVVGLTKAAALDCARLGIRVNAICPGFIDTPLMDRFIAGDPQARARVEARHPMGRMGTPDEIARAVAWLFSDATFMTGHTLTMDGGLTAR
ncbi:MAG: SDR family oxidoreductase [Armatimonadetes bacterium]|nr:SDR family oxidoreductase [Armatimonadota bacterium]